MHEELAGGQIVHNLQKFRLLFRAGIGIVVAVRGSDDREGEPDRAQALMV